jgi:dephospho-CoA kinase
MIVLGLTGSIGMGKSTAAKMLRMMGVPVHDSDKAVHEALLPKGCAYQDVAKLFPSVASKDGIDRKKLGSIVFADKIALKKLEAVLHPVAHASQQKFTRAMQGKGKKIVVLEIPLLFETGAEERVDYTITVTSPAPIQKRRVLKRKNMSEEKFKSILASQIPDAEKQALADFVVDTGLGYARTYRQLKHIIESIRHA